MDALLRQSKGVCPFLKRTSPATLRALSTAVRPSPASSPCGGTMTKLQVLANRCPIMGKALAVQSARLNRSGSSMPAAASALAGLRAMSAARAKTVGTRAKLHTSRAHEARALEGSLFGHDKSKRSPLRSG